MDGRIARALFIIFLAVCISGCSSVLTRMGPLIYRLEDGEKFVGDFGMYKYSGGIYSNVIHLERTPMCSEVAEKIRVAQKQPRGRVFALVEMVFFGFGYLDMINAQAVVEDSKVVEPLAKYDTGKYVVCGKKEPAANTMLLIEDNHKTIHKQAVTDVNGYLDLDKVLADENRVLNLTISLASDHTRAVSFIYTPPGQ